MNDKIFSFRDKDTINALIKKINKYTGPKIKLMEVCGTHTMAISKFGIREVLPNNINLYSGPGCPVCVTPSYYIKSAIELSNRDNFIITTFGDMMRIPFNGTNLLTQRALGSDIRIIYSPEENLEIAKQNPDKKIVFLSVGFETTIPVIAISAIEAYNQGIHNYFLLTANKTIYEPLKVLSSDSQIGINGYIYPGHVSSIIGNTIYKEISQTYGIPGVITGFEPTDILASIGILIDNIQKQQSEIINLYSRVVNINGNPKALSIMNEVFEPQDAIWRGIGNIPKSGMQLKDKYKHMDGWSFLDKVNIENSALEDSACLCGEILKGKALPNECKLFGTVCTPENPIGSCMVSSEGTCAAYFKYSR